MPYAINHIHLKSNDPETAAAWWVKAFNFTIVRDSEQAGGVRFIACDSENGVRVNISNAGTELLRDGDVGVREGLEYFGFDSDNLEQDIERLSLLGARLVDGPRMAATARVCFLEVPGRVRIELVERV